MCIGGLNSRAFLQGRALDQRGPPAGLPHLPLIESIEVFWGDKTISPMFAGHGESEATKTTTRGLLTYSATPGLRT